LYNNISRLCNKWSNTIFRISRTFIAQIHPQFVVPLPQPIFTQTGQGTTPHVPQQQQVVAEQQQQQHPVPN
jgi:hypothetical protein